MSNRLKFILPYFLALSSAVLSCQDTKKIYIANDCHTDYMWSANEDAYRQAFIDMLDYYLNLADSTSGEAADFQSRFNCDGSFWVWVYEKNKAKADFERLINAIKNGHITVPLTLLNICYGGMPAEAIFRSMYYAGQLERQFGLRLPLAMSQENQTLPYGLGALWAGAGAKYSWKGICGCASRVPDAWDRKYDMYWWVGPDDTKILMKWNSMIRQNNYDIGGYAEARDIPGVINYADSDAGFRAHYPYNIIGIFGYGGDDLKALTDKFTSVAKQASTSARKVIVSNEVDFFQDFEKNYSDSLPSQSASFGNEWDVLSASMSELSARVKRAVEKLRAAEAMAALVSLQDPVFMRGREQDREKAWLNMGLYFEHDWTADGPVSRDARAAWQRTIASAIENYVENLYRDASSSLGSMIRAEPGKTRFFVFNPLSWARTDFADFAYAGSVQVHVVDLETGREAPMQIISRDGGRYLRVWAENIPSVGYKVYEIVQGTGSTFGGGPTASGNTIENGVYKITVASNGAITSLIDKTLGNRETVREVNGRRMNELGSGDGTLEVENAGPVSVTMKATSSSPLAHTASITLFRDSRRVDIRNEIIQNFSGIHTWGFGFNINAPEVWHEETGAVIKARLTEQGGHYSSRNSRYDWLTLNHFADVGSGAAGVTLSNADCYFMKLGASSTSFLDINTPQISVLAGGQVDGGSLGIPNQGGDNHFLQRFALETHDAFNPAAAMRFALEHQNPLVTGDVGGGTKYPANSYSLLEIENGNIFLWSLKPAEDAADNAIVARVWNLSSQPANFTLGFSDYTILDAKRLTHIETPLENAPYESLGLTSSIKARQWLTFSLKLNGEPSPGKSIRRRKIR